MKLLILILSCLSVYAQHPLTTGSGINWTRTLSTPVADYTNLLYADFETDTTESLSSAYVNGSIVVYWTNIAPINPIATAWDLVTSSAVWPYWTNSVTPTGKPAVEFIKNNSTISANIPHWGAAGSNQPNTVIMCLLNRNQFGFFYDNSSGGREFINCVPNTSYGFFAGSGATINSSTTLSNFFLLTAVFNGASSYYRTNGVLMGTGNPGSQGMGVMILGNDLTGASPWIGQLCSFRIYANALNTNDLHTAEQNIATRYLGTTLPPP